jgi:hypothetical protein
MGLVLLEVLDRLTKIDPAVSAADCRFARVRLPQGSKAEPRL